MTDVNSVANNTVGQNNVTDANGKSSLYAKIKAEVEKKKAAYESAMQNMSVITAARDSAKSKYMTHLAEYNKTGNRTSIFLDSQKTYESYTKQFSDSDIDTEVLRGSLQNSNEYLGKISGMPEYLG